ncbi:MAG: hypothetical protein HOL70_14015 [Candidatus Marinimicrobia bacterium]|nr:hypothetical protein [Candidatus Neomarinimicrobiota bacterium]MBT5270547.1 hypothetical protein [Candidatus Neomarinimicrobiota bacterium]MBT5467219.1 hypothetical protein [Candidatus Neomarinimicrobiota bacterium]
MLFNFDMGNVGLRFLESELSFPDGEPSPQKMYLDIDSQPLPPEKFHLADIEKKIIEKALLMHDGVKTKTAVYLGINRIQIAFKRRCIAVRIYRFKCKKCGKKFQPRFEKEGHY